MIAGEMASCDHTADFDASAMWVALSEYGEGNIFAIYPQLLAELYLQEEDARARGEGEAGEAERLVLPSDREWRLKQYFDLVALQRSCNDDPEEGAPDSAQEDVGEVWNPWSLVASQRPSVAPAPVAILSHPTPEWDIAEVVKAARLLWKPPLPSRFEDEQEMRRVYSLIYDVFRYKTVLNQTLVDVHFFNDYPEHAPHRHAVWLFVMELARRRWSARARESAERAAALLSAAGESFRAIERDVWAQRVHFAAAVARIRIKNRAFSMAELLPLHLREERVSASVNKDLVTGWVNMIKAKNVNALIRRLKEMGYTYSSSRQLCAFEYRFDRVCSRFITLRPPPKTSIGQNVLVKEGIIILQEREFCEGAAVLCRALRSSALRGHIAQTHATSPRSTAYLAGQLRELAAVTRAAAAANKLTANPLAAAVPDIGRLYVFGAGEKAGQYVRSLREMGIEANIAPHFSCAVCVLGESVHTDHPLVSAALDGVVAALATPPNSYSAVTDPIDLVCGRGGDLAMLEVLTESEIDGDGKKRVATILEEQKKTLKFLMSKPQIQLVLYETHSALDTENEAMVKRSVSEANRLARERHSLLRRKNPELLQNAEVVAFAALNTPKQTPHNDATEKSVTVAEPLTKTDAAETPTFQEHKPHTHSARTGSECSAKSTALNKRPESSLLRPGTGSTNIKIRPIPEVPDVSTERSPKDPDDDCADVYVPKCDLFEIRRLPNLGNGLDINYILERDGCYLGLIQRKEITRLDAKYMIKVAEERGLFGGAAGPTPTTTASAQGKRKKESNVRKNKGGGFEVERISAPTYASLSRNASRRQSAPAGMSCTAPQDSSDGMVKLCCSKHARRQAAAAAHATSACICDAHHKRRRRSLECPPAGNTSSPPCRMPFPLHIHDVRLELLNELAACTYRATEHVRAVV